MRDPGDRLSPPQHPLTVRPPDHSKPLDAIFADCIHPVHPFNSIFRVLILPAICFLFATAFGSANREFMWPGHGVFTLDVPTEWKIEGEPAEDIAYALRGRPASGVAAFLQITLIALPPDKPVRESELRGRLEESLRPYIAQSVEKEFLPIALKLNQGKGWFAELTDAALVGKPPVANDYKMMRSALVLLERRILMVATMQFDDPTAPVADEMMAIVTSLKLQLQR